MPIYREPQTLLSYGNDLLLEGLNERSHTMANADHKKENLIATKIALRRGCPCEVGKELVHPGDWVRLTNYAPKRSVRGR